MYLHENKILFQQTISEVTSISGIDEAIIEKDYYVSLILKELSKLLPNLIFKGGTSLSKCYHIIDRFSEDLDLTLQPNCLTQANRKSMKQAIVSACKKFGMTIANYSEIKSRFDYNNYKISYLSEYALFGIKSYIEIDTVLSISSYPCEKKIVSSIIGETLSQKGYVDYVKEFELDGFEITVQSLARTFVDKVFALCDYYLKGDVFGRSRHLYDIYKIFPLIKIDINLKNLISETRILRRNSHFCESAKPDIDINKCLSEIIDKEYYKSDYNTITEKLLFKYLPYEQTIKTLSDIVKEKLF